MELKHINLDDLKTARLNVRKQGAKSVSDLVPSIRAMGILQPLLVRPNCEGYEIVAGQRRYHAAKQVAQEASEQGADVAPVPCIVMEDGDDAKAIEASSAENVARLPMDEIDQYKAFEALSKQGKSVEEIARDFGVTERLVSQRLAIARILTPILKLYQKGAINAYVLRDLTLATKAQQKRWLELYGSEDQHAPQGRYLKHWLFGGEEIPVDNALFDPLDYRGNIVTDLFEETRYFDDGKAFWELQNKAIAERREAYLAKGWDEVVLLDVGNYFAEWEHAKAGRKDGGRVYVEIADNGEVSFHEGYITRKEAAKRVKQAEKGEDADNSASARPELTKVMQTYLDLHRHAATRFELLSDPALALRVATAQIIAGSPLWSVQAEPQRTGNEIIEQSLATNGAQEKFAQERKAVLQLLGMDTDEPETVVPRRHDYGVSTDLLSIFAKLIELDDEALTRIFTFVVAETLPSASELVEALGEHLATDMAVHWKPDEAFFDLWKDKEAINAAIREVAGKATADAHLTSTAKLQKKVILGCLEGTRKPHMPDWLPRYMAFPMAGYTRRNGIAALERTKAVQKALKAR
ncbi:MAG: ParB/RepB/Spo0J family partition protein [Hyphomicrobiales bacterium]|nr:ParB/RepB/Spo0J family partition protein [Nitratireductor sp.]MCC2097994.1 ParB/RepB/Spo0J family partition protein [Hyphomicrobiales bacterium]